MQTVKNYHVTVKSFLLQFHEQKDIDHNHDTKHKDFEYKLLTKKKQAQ